MITPCGLGMVLGPFFSRECCLIGTDECCWLLVEDNGGETPDGGGLVDELTFLCRREVDRRTLDWASFKESL